MRAAQSGSRCLAASNTRPTNGAWAALRTVSGLAVLLGRVLLRYLKLSWVHYFGGAVCLLLAGLTAYELIRS